MTDKPQYQLHANSPALSRFQWWIVGIPILVAAVGVVPLYRYRAKGTRAMETRERGAVVTATRGRAYFALWTSGTGFFCR